MDSVYKIRPAAGANLLLNPVTAGRLGLEGKRGAALRFGSARVFVGVNVEGEVPENEIRLPEKPAAGLRLPDYPAYEISSAGGEITFGPYVGMLMAREDKRLTVSRLKRMKIYVSDYKNLHGAVVVFALDKIDVSGMLVEGFCYNPAARKFQRGTFPFPASVYRIVGLDDNWKNFFNSAVGDRMFNGRYVNKWTMYKWLSSDPEVKEKMPATALYNSEKEVLDALKRFGRVYLKPLSGLEGHGIVEAEQDGDTYVFNYREDGENLKDVREGKKQAAEYLRQKLRRGTCLVQQGVRLIRYRGGPVDFRCVMQRNQSAEWVCRAVIGRYGERGSIVSNVSNGGRIFLVDQMRSRSMPLPDRKLAHLDGELRSFSKDVCKVLDGCGVNYGTLGLDIGVDEKGKLWLIEVNNRDPNPTIATVFSDPSVYVGIKTGILEYAKALAGFKKEAD